MRTTSAIANKRASPEIADPAIDQKAPFAIRDRIGVAFAVFQASDMLL
jgi:hypothetical protein